MNRTFATALVTAVSLLAQAGAFAQRRLQATIPFDFSVGEQRLPAGTYVVVRSGPSTVTVQGWKGKGLVSAMTIIFPTDDELKRANRLIFHRYGSQYVLSEIHDQPGNGAGLVSSSKLERRLRLQQAVQESTEIALK